MRKLLIIGIGCILMLTGCSGNKDITMQINVIEQYIMVEDWDALTLHVQVLKDKYSKNEWKIQLLGDEGEYERLNEAINRLDSAIQAKGSEAARLELATIMSIVKDIYSL